MPRNLASEHSTKTVAAFSQRQDGKRRNRIKALTPEENKELQVSVRAGTLSTP